MIRPVSQVSNTLSVIIQVSNTECVRIQVELSQPQQMVQVVKGLQYPKGERARQKIYRKGIKGRLDKRNQFPWHEPLLKWMAVHHYPSCSILHLYSDMNLDFLYFHSDVMYNVCLVKLSFLMDFMHFSSTPAHLFNIHQK